MPLLDLLASSPLAYVTTCCILGLIIGSYLNVVVYRLPQKMERDWKAQSREMHGQ
ncbi:prepilin peptidase, partial [Pseudomonas syringae pv. tagetis]|uniref:prepilin peptidase n=1 Tax=Pseudomonas syringae group genomosp. 7 TaxID=251699 RepID=UPI00376F8E56